MSPEGAHGKAYGVLTWRGKEDRDGQPQKVRGPLKKEWRQLATESSTKPAWQSLAAAAFNSEQQADSAAAEAASEGVEEQQQESEAAPAETEAAAEEAEPKSS